MLSLNMELEEKRHLCRLLWIKMKQGFSNISILLGPTPHLTRKSLGSCCLMKNLKARMMMMALLSLDHWNQLGKLRKREVVLASTVAQASNASLVFVHLSLLAAPIHSLTKEKWEKRAQSNCVTNGLATQALLLCYFFCTKGKVSCIIKLK